MRQRARSSERDLSQRIVKKMRVHLRLKSTELCFSKQQPLIIQFLFIADTEKVLAQKISEGYEGPPDKEQLPRMLLKEIAAAPKGATEERAEGASAPVSA